MNRREFGKLSALALAATALRARAQTLSGIMSPVLTRGYNNARTGANMTETILTQANVATQGIRRVATLAMQGDLRGCEAQPLIVPSVLMDDGVVHDIVVALSMAGSMWIWDANNYKLLFEKQLATPVLGTNAIDAWNINDHWSFISTGVVDPATNILYGVGWSDPNGNAATAIYYIHVLNLKDGSRVCPPVPLAGLSSNGQNFGSMMRKQRSSLVMTNVGGSKTVFFGCGTVQETSNGAAGWIIAFGCATNTIISALALSSGKGAGIWMGGSGLCADGDGNLYAVTGNGGFDGVTDFGESVIKLQFADTELKVVDHWTPFTDAARDGGTSDAAKIAGISGPSRPVNMAMTASPYAGWDDEDLGSGGLLLTPSGALIVCGKDGIGYVVNSAKMGGTTPAQVASGANFAQLMAPPLWLTYFPGYGTNAAPLNPTALDVLWGGKTRHMHSCPVLFQSSIHGTMVFVWGENSPLRAWSLSAAGVLTFLAQGNEIASANVTGSPGGMPGGFMCLSANGSKTGTALLWATIPYGNANQAVGNGRLLCYDAENFVNGAIKPLWDSQAENIAFVYNKFDPPVCSGGKLFVPTYSDGVDVYALA